MGKALTFNDLGEVVEVSAERKRKDRKLPFFNKVQENPPVSRTDEILREQTIDRADRESID